MLQLATPTTKTQTMNLTSTNRATMHRRAAKRATKGPPGIIKQTMSLHTKSQATTHMESRVTESTERAMKDLQGTRRGTKIISIATSLKVCGGGAGPSASVGRRASDAAPRRRRGRCA